MESRRLLTTMSLYPIPSPGGQPTQITTGSDGNLWFTAGDSIGTINPTTHVITQFSLPENYENALGITSGPDGNLWFTNDASSDGVTSGAIGMINPTTDAITEFPVTIAGSSPSQITTGPDGNLWFTDPGSKAIGIINPTTDAITEFPLPGSNSSPFGITTGPDGNIWFTETASNTIGTINLTTDAISEFTVPTPGFGPKEIVLGSDGNLWVTGTINEFAIFNPSTDVITQIQEPGVIGDITAGSNGTLLYTCDTGGFGDLIGIIQTTSSTNYSSTMFLPALPDSQAEGLTLGPDGNVWFAATNDNAIGVLASGGPGVAAAVFSPVISTETVALQPADAIGVQDSPGIGSQPNYLTAPPASITPWRSFGFTLTVDGTSAGNDASSTGAITVSLADGPGGATMSVTTKHGTSTDSGLTLKKHDNSYRLVAGAGSHVTRLVNQADVASTRPILAEKVLTAGKGKHEHVVGVEVSISKAIARSLTADIPSRPAGSAAERVGFQVDYGSSPGAAGEALVGKARLGRDGQVIVVAKS